MSLNMLVVEDNDLAGTAVTTLFDTLGFNVHLVTNGLDAMPYLIQNPLTDIIILDLELPGMTGDKIYAAIRANEQTKNIPIIPFTAHRDTRSAGSLPSNLILAEYTKTGKIPEIVFKGDGSNESKDINQILVDEVAYALMSNGKPITEEMATWYMQTRGLSANDFFRGGR